MFKKNKEKKTTSTRNRIINWLIVLILLITAIVCGYLWINQQPYTSPVKKTVRQITTTVAPQNTSGLDKNKIATNIMAQDQTGLRLTKQGYVAIPDLGIFLPIYDNAYDAKALDVGADTAQKNNPVPVMGQGNYTLAAHNWDNGYTGFSALQQFTNKNAPYLTSSGTGTNSWLNGKSIYLANDKGIYEYKITGQHTTGEDDISPLDPSLTEDGQPMLSIMTCLFPNIHYRIMTIAKYNGFTTWNDASDQLAGYFDTSKVKTNIRP